MSESPSDDLQLGPIDYLVVEYPNGRPTGEALPYLIDLVDKGLIRILDLAVVAKDAEGNLEAISLQQAIDASDEWSVFDGVQTGLLDADDLAEVGGVISAGSIGAILVYENTWAAPFASALRRAGAQLVADGRIPVNALLAALEEENA